MTDYTPKFLARFWSKISRTDNPDECWLWTGAMLGKYGGIWLNNGPKYTHRIAYEIANGSFDANLFVLHSCDTPLCCNPNHLFLGTALTNAQDKTAKQRNGVPYGEVHTWSKLTNDQVSQIRQLYASGHITQQQLADMFCTTPSNISCIVRKKSRKKS